MATEMQREGLVNCLSPERRSHLSHSHFSSRVGQLLDSGTPGEEDSNNSEGYGYGSNGADECEGNGGNVQNRYAPEVRVTKRLRGRPGKLFFLSDVSLSQARA